MKRLVLISTIILFCIGLYAQQKNVPFTFSIPVTAAKTKDPYSNGTVTWSVKIYEKNKGKQLVWQEGSSTDTDGNGVLKINVGKSGEAMGTYTSFNEINFGMYKYYIVLEFLTPEINEKGKKYKMNASMYSMYARNTAYAVNCDTAKIALSSANDTDGDGISDNVDKERFSPVGTQVDKYGRAIDSDNDGVADIIDEEKDTKPEDAKYVNFKGISLKNAGGSGSGNAVGGKGGDFLPVIFFEREFVLGPHNCSLLMVVYNYMKANPSAKIRVIGHTDSFGTDEYNFRLGMRRAQAVADAIIALGIEEERLIIESKGETDHLVDLTQFNALNFNRRVHFEIAD